MLQEMLIKNGIMGRWKGCKIIPVDILCFHTRPAKLARAQTSLKDQVINQYEASGGPKAIHKAALLYYFVHWGEEKLFGLVAVFQ